MMSTMHEGVRKMRRAEGEGRRRHQLVYTRGGHYCELCKWTFQTRTISECPGVPRYDYDKIPDILLTLPQLKHHNLKPVSPPDACYHRLKAPHWIWYYDARKAVPYHSIWQRLNMWSRMRDGLDEKSVCKWCSYEATSEEERRLIRSRDHCEKCLFEISWIRCRKDI